MSKGIGFMNEKLDLSLSELTIISCALDDYYHSQVARYKSSEYYECVEIKELLDDVDSRLSKANKKVEKNKAKQPTPDW